MDKLNYTIRYTSYDNEDKLYVHDKLPLSFVLTENRTLKNLNILDVQFDIVREDITDEAIAELEEITCEAIENYSIVRMNTNHQNGYNVNEGTKVKIEHINLDPIKYETLYMNISDISSKEELKEDKINKSINKSEGDLGKKETKSVLPRTGETTSSLLLIGVIMAGLGISFAVKRKQG